MPRQVFAGYTKHKKITWTTCKKFAVGGGFEPATNCAQCKRTNNSAIWTVGRKLFDSPKSRAKKILHASFSLGANY